MHRFQPSSPSSLRSVTRALLAAGFAAMLAPATAQQIAIDPGDYTALPPGTDLGIVYYERAQYNKVYANRQQLPVSFDLATDITLTRYVHYTRLGDYVVTPQVLVPAGRVASGQQSANGIGDPVVGSALWLVNQPDERRWFNVSAYASVPVGKYDAEKGPINLGEHRWKGVFQSAYITPLSTNVMFDFVGEYAIYGENDDFIGMRRKQDASYSGQAHLRYLFSPTNWVAVSYYHEFGGENKLNGVEQHDRMNNSRFLVGLTSFVAPTVQLQMQVGKALKVANGPKESGRLNLRLVKIL